PQSVNHPQYWHTLPRRHGDMVRTGGGSAANDLISMGTHVGTHIDSLAHVSQDGKLYGGASAADSCIGGKYVSHGVHTIPPFFGRGVLIDVATFKGVDCLPGGYEITQADLEGALQAAGITLESGDTVMIRSGWGGRFGDYRGYMGAETGVPGIGEAAAKWLVGFHPFAIGADSTALEVISAEKGHGELPVHRVLLVEQGIYIIETLNLEELSQCGRGEFVLSYTPLNLYGATGSPIRPLALIEE
ncbi:MAG: cyclase family protein, partial [Microbacteriaceae bacterium]